ncbi:SDR family NAD(P)-dependent oxidoreductase [Pseudohalocynthiibacter sp. F2068]|jgi:NADP-dependent 3-hydroxy acid dehydrogenase YdfG|uniref:SDR family NAD(P)-dependent oxidoreductase n=1 Tax=Pseudohalocynthiibacter sp. F2068 TaxID=2926418 RepID=UPI001FF66C2D|nr:SDR family NAD(P)-dependent oxidoreductase [Pseudohalocynthiibacter sp. F2068]MCK0104435.1 SDR family NAD(P)-dependent oxidoreductase [Pseudohalocynthiibacter sp. F2068]
MMQPKNRVIMISGANRGIGWATTLNLYEKGYSLSLGARNEGQLRKVTADLDPNRIMTHSYDAVDSGSGKAWVASTADHFGRIDGLVNNAGMGGSVNLEDDDDDAFREIFEVNAMGPMRMIRFALPYLRAAGNGRIVNVASLSGKRVINDGTGYAMSKFALMAVSHAARRAAWDDGVRVTAVCPGWVNTDLAANAGQLPREEMIQAEDLAELVATAIALPNNAHVAELLISCSLGESY